MTTGVPAADIPHRLIEENMWRALRYGLDGDLLDLVALEPYPGGQALERLLSWTAPMRDELGLEVALPPENGAQRQRAMIAAGMDVHEIYAAVQAETRATYSRARQRHGGDPVSSGQTGDAQTGGPEGSMSEEELRAAYEAEIKQIRVEQVLLEQIVTLVNLGMRRTGLQPGTEDERDLGQVRLAIESIRVQLPLVEQIAAPEAGQIRDALSQLQLAFVRLGGSAEAAGARARTPGRPAGSPGAARARAVAAADARRARSRPAARRAGCRRSAAAALDPRPVGPGTRPDGYPFGPTARLAPV